MTQLTSSDGEQREISDEDLLNYLAGDLEGAELRDWIARQAETEGSYVQQWMAEMARRAREPFERVDWGRVAEVGDEKVEEGNDRET